MPSILRSRTYHDFLSPFLVFFFVSFVSSILFLCANYFCAIILSFFRVQLFFCAILVLSFFDCDMFLFATLLYAIHSCAIFCVCHFSIFRIACRKVFFKCSYIKGSSSEVNKKYEKFPMCCCSLEIGRKSLENVFNFVPRGDLTLSS